MTGHSGKSADAAKDRRAQSGQRVHFEAMVAVGGAEGGAAFEAESVDVSSQGMRLRTAYLPVVGDQLVCRFDGPEGELIAVGEVLWATEQQKGGEFGLKFMDLDPATEQALKALSVGEGSEQAEQDEPEPARPKVAKNARVKLHIEGLASPMKARVQGGDDKQVCVGSSLEFLKLGRQVEVEDVDVGDRREGFVDAVKVEIDAATSVPQLVVTLRFDAARVGASQPAKSARAEKLDDGIEPAPITRIAGTPASRRGEAEIPKPSRKKDSVRPASVPPAEAVAAGDASAEDDDEMLPPNKLRAAQDRAKDFTTMAASKIAPAFSKVGMGARGFLASIRGTMDKRREAREEAKKASAPRRVTAPPPSGALTSEGRRVVRQDQGGKDSDEEPVSISPKRSRKGVAIGAAAGLALVLGIVGVTKAIGSGDEPAPQGAVASADARKANGAAVPPIPGAPAVADVPLYGATPLTTTEQVIAQQQASAAAAKAGADDAGDDAEPAEKSELVREWGNGELKNAKTFKVKMDAAVEGFSATEQEDGFSIVVPKRQSMSTSSALVRKDKRLSGVDVENREDGVEIRMKFKGEPPAYKVKVRSDRVEISLGEEGSSGKATPAKKADPKKVAAKPAAKKKKTDKKPAAKKP